MASNCREIEERVQLALDKARTQPSPNISKLAREFDVPRMRLSRRWHGIGARTDRQPTNYRLTEDQELALIIYCKKMDEIGLSCDIHKLETTAFQMLCRTWPDPTTPPPPLGHNWARRFLDRHPELVLTKQKPTKPLPTTSYDPDANCQQAGKQQTPPPQDYEAESPKTPLTIRSLRRAITFATSELADASVDSLWLQKVLKGALAQAETGARAFAELKAQAAADQEMEQREVDCSEATPAGDAMYVEEAGSIEAAAVIAEGGRAKKRNEWAQAEEPGRVVKRRTSGRSRRSVVVQK